MHSSLTDTTRVTCPAILQRLLEGRHEIRHILPVLLADS